MDDIESIRVARYKTLIQEGLMSDGPHVFIVEAFAACISVALRLVAMLNEKQRSDLCDILEAQFRKDAENLASQAGARSGITRLQ